MAYTLPKDTETLLGNRPVENASLRYEKYLLPSDYSGTPQEKESAFSQLLTATIPVSAGNKPRHLAKLLRRSYGTQTRTVFAKLMSRMAINMADGLIENAGIALDRNTGAPYVPASAVKGCCRHIAYWMEKRGELATENIEYLFGTTDKQGSVIFLPGHHEGVIGFDLDILTPHPRQNGRESNPVPNKFPVVKEGTRFAFSYIIDDSLSDADFDAIHSLMGLILEAVFENGMGAKTAAGLGWFQRDLEFEETLKKQQDKELAKEKEYAAERAREAAQQAAAEATKREQEANRVAAEKLKTEEEAAKKAAYDAACPEEQLRITLSNQSKKNFEKTLRGISQRNPLEQRIVLEVFLSKNANAQKKYLKDKKVGPKLKAAAGELGIQL
ncbi:MAG: type III-B CRISPR module RAMP protein Cmr6 [Puniceicoccaceae bacterium]|nr:type III-B CRISPR module RAMP protein Cmr6 [Puniceicoccaceae bacterium]